MKNAEDSWKAGRDEEQVDILARKAISTAVKAESTAAVRKEAREKRNERTRADAEMREAENKFVDAQNDINALKNELANEKRARELAERDASNYSKQVGQLQQELDKFDRTHRLIRSNWHASKPSRKSIVNSARNRKN